MGMLLGGFLVLFFLSPLAGSGRGEVVGKREVW